MAIKYKFNKVKRREKQDFSSFFYGLKNIQQIFLKILYLLYHSDENMLKYYKGLLQYFK